ncbi:hypothetical protein JCM3770_000145 [Rhodotorula araucariae]
MPAHKSPSSTGTASRPPSTPLRVHLTLVPPEHAAPIPAYPGFSDRLHATDTWERPSRMPVSPPAAPRLRTASSPSPAASLSPKPCALSPLSAATEAPCSPPAVPRRARTSSQTGSTAPGRPGGSSGASKPTWRAVWAAQADAVRQAVQQGQLDANTYTDGQLHVVKQQAARQFLAGHPGAEGGDGKKRRRRASDVEGRWGQVVKAVKTRQSTWATSGAGSDDYEAVEVDLGEMLGL